LSERQILGVLFAKETGKITNADYQKLTDISPATARRDLKDLVDRNIFAMNGVRKGIFYVIRSRQ
jgi:ATP-dependent DNA helicase RecG